MRIKSLVAAIVLLTAASCVDKDFQLDKVSTEVAIGGDVTTLPLGYLERQKLGDIIDLEDIEGLSVDESGNYSLSFEGAKSEISIDGIENRFDIAKTISTFSTEYPTFDITGASCVIDRPYSITTDFGNLHIPQGVAIPVPAGYTIKAKEEGHATEVLEYDVPDYLKTVKRIYLKPQNSGDKGAAIKLSLLLHDIAVVNGGGHINLELVANDGYELYDQFGNKLKEIDHQGRSTTYLIADEQYFAAGTEKIDFTVYLNSIANESLSENGKLKIPIDFGYHLSFDITSRAGTLTLNQTPELHIDTTLQYYDADIVLNEVMLLEHGALAGNATSITIDNLPKEIKSVKRVDFSDHSPMHLLAEGLDWLDDTIAEHIVIEAQLPDYLTLHDQQQSGYNAATHTLRTNLNNLRHKIDINLDALVFGGEGVVPTDGTIVLDFTPDIAAFIEDGTEVKLSKILHEKEIEFSAGFDNTTLELVSVEGKIGYKYDEQATIELGGLNEDIELNVIDAGLLPVITLNVENPLTLGANVTALLTPIADGKESSENCVTINNVEIKAATIAGDKIQSSSTTLILADDSLRKNYADDKFTFVACDLGKLFTGSFPDKIKLDFSISTDENSVHTIYITDNYTISYDYNIDVPLTFDDTLNIAIEKRIEDIAETFTDVSELDITLDDITIIANITNTIPFDFGFEAEALNAQGKPASVKLVCQEPDNTIRGSADGVSEEHSTIRLAIQLGKGGNIGQIAEVDAIMLKLQAKRSHPGSATLNANQSISMVLKMEINGKINVDLGNI